MLRPESVAAFAAVLADRSRMAMCLALLDHRAWTAGELARHAGIARSTASEHLHLLVAQGVVTEVHQGRRRYVRLATPEVAQLIEDLGAAAGVPQRSSSSAAVRATHRLAEARTCYDHLAGALGVAILDALLSRRLLDDGAGLSLTATGREWCEGLGIDLTPERRGTRPLLRECLDWTERRPHLGGVLGAALCDRLFALDWVARAPHHPRAVTVTAAGARGLADGLGIDLAPGHA